MHYQTPRTLAKRALKWQCRQFKITNDYSNVKTLNVSIKGPGLAFLPVQWLQHRYSEYSFELVSHIHFEKHTALPRFGICMSADRSSIDSNITGALPQIKPPQPLHTPQARCRSYPPALPTGTGEGSATTRSLQGFTSQDRPLFGPKGYPGYDTFSTVKAVLNNTCCAPSTAYARKVRADCFLAAIPILSRDLSNPEDCLLAQGTWTSAGRHTKS